MNYEIITKKIHLKNILIDCFLGLSLETAKEAKLKLSVEIHLSQSIQVSPEGVSNMLDVDLMTAELHQALNQGNFDHLGSLCERAAMTGLNHDGVLGVRVIATSLNRHVDEADLGYEIFMRKNKRAVMHQ